MKSKILLFLTIFMTLFMTNVCYGENNINFDTPITLKVNGQYIKTDTEPFLHKGLTYVPIRFVSAALGADEINWNEKSKTATIKDDSLSISLTPGQKNALVNGKKVSVSGSVLLENDRIYVPVRFVAENMNANVLWVGETYTVEITKASVKVPDSLIAKRNYTDDDIYWLSRIVNAESGGESMKGKIAVANTVLNRVKSQEFPNTIYSVIFDKNYGVQFEPTINGTIYRTPVSDSIIAAKRALNGENIVGNCMYFLNPDIATNFWIVKNRTFYTTIGNHDFYL